MGLPAPQYLVHFSPCKKLAEDCKARGESDREYLFPASPDLVWSCPGLHPCMVISSSVAPILTWVLETLLPQLLGTGLKECWIPLYVCVGPWKTSTFLVCFLSLTHISMYSPFIKSLEYALLAKTKACSNRLPTRREN